MGVSFNGFSSCINVKFPLENTSSFKTSKLLEVIFTVFYIALV